MDCIPKVVSRLVLIVGIICAISTQVLALPMVSFDVSNLTPSISDTITVDVIATDVTELFTYNLDIIFDTAIFGSPSVSPGTFLGSGGGFTLSAFGLFSFDPSTPGEIQNISDSLLGLVPGVTGSGILATLSFDILSTNEGSLTFMNVNLPGGTELINTLGAAISITNAPGASVNAVSVPIPEPSTGLLVVTGIALLTMMKGYRRLNKN